MIASLRLSLPLLGNAAILSLLASSSMAEVDVAVLQKLTAADAAAGDEFGFSVWTDGQRLAVGALEDDDNGEASGSVYLYEFDGGSWLQTQKLLAPDGEPGDQFGQVRLLGDLLAVGARTDDLPGAPNGGSVYLFTYDGVQASWVFQQQLIASAASAGDICTISELWPNHLLMPCTRDDPGGITDAGGLFVFEREGESWIERAQLVPLAAAPGDNFGGGAFDSQGPQRLVGGSRRADGVATDAGGLWVFEQDPQNSGVWLELGELVPADLQAGDEYAARGAFSGDLLAVSAPEANDTAPGAGAVYLFARDEQMPTGWRLEAKVLSEDTLAGDNLGRGLTWFSPDVVIAGAPDDATRGPLSGAIYVFRRDECADGAWGQAAKFIPQDVAVGDLFGRQMSASGDGSLLAVSAWSHDAAAADAGAVYMLSVSDPLDSDGDGVLDDRDNCTTTMNPNQRDSNGDGYGNVCDADLDDSGRVTVADLRLLVERLFTADADADLNGDGTVTVADFTLAREQLFQVPGPSGPVRCFASSVRAAG
ncbi:MAG: hypothetical protein AAGA68_24860 [Pseudomonadota bacterium]